MIVLIHCVGLVSLIVVIICLCQHCMISSTTEHLLTFMITIAVILPARYSFFVNTGTLYHLIHSLLNL